MLRVGSDMERLRAEELKLMYDHRPPRLRASTAVDIGQGIKTRRREERSVLFNGHASQPQPLRLINERLKGRNECDKGISLLTT